MKNLKALMEQREELQSQLSAIVELADTEERAINDEESAKFDKLEKQIKAIDTTIEMEERANSLVIEKSQEIKKEEGVKVENINVLEERAFESFIRGTKGNVEERADTFMQKSSNGSVVPKTIADRIIVAVKDKVDFLASANVQYANGTLAVPKYTNSNEASYIDENGGSDAVNGDFTTIDLTGYTIEAVSLVTNTMINNVDFDVVSWVVNDVADMVANKLEKEFINGTASKITGILSTTKGQTTASATAITYDELLTLKHSLKKAYRKNGKFIMQDTTYTAICKLKDNNGKSYFEDDAYKIFGCDVLVSDNMPDMGAGKKAVVFADLSGYTIKFSKAPTTNLLDQLYARKNSVGVQVLVEIDGKITDENKIVALTMKAA